MAGAYHVVFLVARNPPKSRTTAMYYAWFLFTYRHLITRKFISLNYLLRLSSSSSFRDIGRWDFATWNDLSQLFWHHSIWFPFLSIFFFKCLTYARS